MARLALLLTIILASFAGCGDDEGGGGGGTGTPLGNALAYVPKGSPFVVAISTDVEGSQYGSLQKIGERFPFSGLVKERLEDSLMMGKLDYEKDLKPALGNEFVVAAADPRTFVSDDESDDAGEDFVGAIEAKDGKALDALVKKSDVKKAGEASGATLYESNDGSISAIDGETLVVAGDRKDLEEALARHDGEDHVTTEEFEKAVEGLPEESLFRSYFDLAVLLETDPEAKEALKVPYLAAAETFGLSASATDDSVTFDFRLATGGGELSPEDLPLASGPDSPEVLDSTGRINLGIRDPGQLLTFGEAAGQAVDPSGFGDYNAGKEAFESRVGIDIEEDLLGALESDAAISISPITRDFEMLAKVSDPGEFKRTLDKIGPALKQYGSRVTYALKGDTFLLTTKGDDSPDLGVDAETSPVEGAEGAFSMKADAEELAGGVAERMGPQGQSAGPFLGALEISRPPSRPRPTRRAGAWIVTDRPRWHPRSRPRSSAPSGR